MALGLVYNESYTTPQIIWTLHVLNICKQYSIKGTVYRSLLIENLYTTVDIDKTD